MAKVCVHTAFKMIDTSNSICPVETDCLFWKSTSTMEVCYNNELTAQTKYTDCVHGNIKHF